MRWLLFIVLCCNISIAQEVKLLNKTALEADQFVGFDNFKHLYYVKNNTLHKQGALGTFFFQDFQLGPITSVDIINPLNVVVFYEQLATVVFLDNRLNELERINFNDLPNFLNVSVVANAGNNRLWAFNMDTQQLELYHYRTQLETIISQPFEGNIQAISSNFNDCTLLFDDAIRKINIYGSLLFEIPVKNISQLVSFNQTTLAFQENECYKVQDKSLQKMNFSFTEKAIKQLQLTKDFLYIYNGETLFTYTLTQPN